MGSKPNVNGLQKFAESLHDVVAEAVTELCGQLRD